jgi:OPA family sugar phosphate sensor protein UhpC-like MFS transporter
MCVPGVIAIMTSFFLINRLRDTPETLGLPPVEKFRQDYPDPAHPAVEERSLSTRELLVDYVLKNPYIWLLGIAYFFVYVVRVSASSWTVLFLKQSKGYTVLGASGISSLFEIGGILGSLSAGWASDYFFGAKRGPVNAMYALGMLGSVFLFWIVPKDYPMLDAIAVFLLGFTVFGPQMLIGMAAAELSHKDAAATATGFVGFIAYMGSAAAGYPLGRIIDDFGWQGFFFAMLVCCIASFLCLLPLWNVTHRSYHKNG